MRDGYKLTCFRCEQPSGEPSEFAVCGHIHGRIAELETALRRYGRHEGGPDGCRATFGTPDCTCGLGAVLGGS